MTSQHNCMRFDADDPNVRRLGLGAPAMRYQSWGYAVLPLARGGKKPHRMLPYGEHGKNGVHYASPSYADASVWWNADAAANVGVATGSISRLAVIDLDLKGKDNGTISFSAFLVENRCEMPAWLPWAQTPSGGYHLWLRTPPGVVVPERPGILPGVDVKGDGGLVAAPPSMLLTSGLDRPGERSGGEVPLPYRWAAGCPCKVPDAPPWLLPWLTSAVSTGHATSGGGSLEEAPDVEKLMVEGIPTGERNDTLYRVACSLYRKHGCSPEGTVEVMEVLNTIWGKNREGMPPSELLTISDSARRFVAAQVAQEIAIAHNWMKGQS